MKHPYVVVWLADGCAVQALPTPRGKRNALLLNRGLITAVLKLSEDDYQELLVSGPVSAHTGEGGWGASGQRPRDNGGSAGARAGARPRVGVVPRDDTGAGKPS